MASRFRSIRTVAIAAIRATRALIGVEAFDGRIDLSQRIDVVNAAGTLVHQLAFVALEIARRRSAAPARSLPPPVRGECRARAPSVAAQRL